MPICSDVLQEPELCEQYVIEYGGNGRQIHSIQYDLFICSCGAINRLTEEKCHSCGMLKKQLEDFDIDELKKNYQLRREQEEAEKTKKAAEAERLKQEAHKAHMKKVRNTVLRTGLVFVLLVGGVFALNQYGQMNDKYQYAMSQLESGDYESALEGFNALGNFKDSPERVKQVKDSIDKEKAAAYKEAKGLLEVGDAVGALNIFEGLTGYKDVDELNLVAYEQVLINKIYDDNFNEGQIDYEYERLNDNEIREVMKGSWVFVAANCVEKITFTDDEKATTEDGTVYKWKIDDDMLLFYEYDGADEENEKDTMDDKFKHYYTVVKGSKEGYYIGTAVDNMNFEFDKLLLPVDSEYVKRLKAHAIREAKLT